MIYAITCILMILFDQATKYYARTHLRLLGSKPIIEGFFHLTYVENRGAAFGVLQGQGIVLAVLTVVTIALLLSYVKKNKEDTALKWIAMLIVSGAIGNLIDRMFLGYVTDFIDFRGIWSYVFNVADMFVVCGGIAMCLHPILDEIALKFGHK